jgi:hypothetical protein
MEWGRRRSLRPNALAGRRRSTAEERSEPPERSEHQRADEWAHVRTLHGAGRSGRVSTLPTFRPQKQSAPNRARLALSRRSGQGRGRKAHGPSHLVGQGRNVRGAQGSS